jgi:UDP-glucose 4-epimerase
VKGADVVVHLAFAVLTASDRTAQLNVDGSRNVFEAAVEAGAERICYASSVAAYGFHADNPDWLTEDIPPRGTPEHPYSAQKAEVEGVLAQTLLRSERTKAWVFRPCIVAGPRAQTFLAEIPYFRISEALPDPVRRFLSGMPILKPVIPDAGPRFQLVHHDDVASAFVAGVFGKGSPGRTTSPAAARSRCPTWPTPSAGTRCRCPTSPWTPQPNSSRACRACRPSSRGSTRCASRC